MIVVCRSYLRQVELIQVRMMIVVYRSYLRQVELIQVRMMTVVCGRPGRGPILPASGGANTGAYDDSCVW